MAIVRFSVRKSAAILGCLAGLLLGINAAQADQIRVATEGTYKPFSYFTSGGELTGFDVELTLAICKAATLDCVMVTMDNDAVIPALKDNKIDVISTGMSITEKRKKVVLFTDRIRSSGKQFVSCAPDKFPDVSPESLKGHILGTQAGTTNADFFQAKYAASDIRLYKTMDEAFKDLAAGRVELALSQIALGYDFTNSSEGAGCKFVGPRLDDTKFFGDGVALGLRPSDVELKAAFDTGIKKVLADGTYKAINAKYFPFSLY